MFMKYLQPYNESLRDQMVPKSDDEIKDKIKNMSGYELLINALYKLYDIDLVEKALKKKPNIDKEFISDLTLSWHYDETLLDIMHDNKIEEDSFSFVDTWFIGHCLDEQEDVQYERMEFYKEALALILNHDDVLEQFSALEILGLKQLL